MLTMMRGRGKTTKKKKIANDCEALSTPFTEDDAPDIRDELIINLDAVATTNVYDVHSVPSLARRQGSYNYTVGPSFVALGGFPRAGLLGKETLKMRPKRGGKVVVPSRFNMFVQVHTLDGDVSGIIGIGVISSRPPTSLSANKFPHNYNIVGGSNQQHGSLQLPNVHRKVHYVISSMALMSSQADPQLHRQQIM